MFHKARLAGDEHASIDSINDARVSNGLKPFEAPSERSQVFTAVVIVLVTSLFILLTL